MNKYRRFFEPLRLALIVGLTLSTGYIHYRVGGILLTLNAAGYLTLAASVVVTAVAFRRLLPLVLMALAAYAAVTIVGWLIMGPYFDIAYLAKAIEIVLITTIAFTLRRMGDETKAALLWLFLLPAAVIAMRQRQPSKGATTATSDK